MVGNSRLRASGQYPAGLYGRGNQIPHKVLVAGTDERMRDCHFIGSPSTMRKSQSSSHGQFQYHNFPRYEIRAKPIRYNQRSGFRVHLHFSHLPEIRIMRWLQIGQVALTPPPQAFFRWLYRRNGAVPDQSPDRGFRQGRFRQEKPLSETDLRQNKAQDAASQVLLFNPAGREALSRRPAPTVDLLPATPRSPLPRVLLLKDPAVRTRSPVWSLAPLPEQGSLRESR